MLSRNVEALVTLLQRHCPPLHWADGGKGPDFFLTLAERLATEGVLCVDSLTDEQARALYPNALAHLVDANDVRAALRRCATGGEA